uniref:Band 7 domain-containing protein n=1 Tax=Alexandrium catenella TaxID=2925 RepID=A0A7S1LTW0_ALECA
MEAEGTAHRGDQHVTTAYRKLLEGWGELVKCLCCPFLCLQAGPIAVVDQGWVAVLTRFGVYERVLPPGMYVYNCISQSLQKVCMKMQVIEIPRQAAMTRDNLSVTVDAVTFVTVVDAARAVFQVADYLHAVKTLAASTLLRVIGEHDLQEIFRDRSKINDRLTQTMQGKTAGWGLQVAGVEMRDITIPEAMQRAMAQIAEANREADAKVIVAEGQRKAAFIFADAAEAMERQPMSLQLQWFETLRQISAEKNSTVIVPDSVVSSLGGLGVPGRSSGPGPKAMSTPGQPQCQGGV